MSSFLILLPGILIFLVARLIHGRLRRRFIDKLPGPPSSSWLTGLFAVFVLQRQLNS